MGGILHQPSADEMTDHRLKIEAALIRFRLHLATQSEVEAHGHATAKASTASVSAGILSRRRRRSRCRGWRSPMCLRRQARARGVMMRKGRDAMTARDEPHQPGA